MISDHSIAIINNILFFFSYLDDANSSLSDSAVLSSQASDEMSFSHNTVLARILQQRANKLTALKRSPVLLPGSNTQDRIERTHSESSLISQDSTSNPVLSPSRIHFTGFKKPPVPLPSSAGQDRNENTHSESSSIIQDSTPHPLLSPSEIHFTGFTRPPVPLPTSAGQDRNENTHSESSSITQNLTSHPFLSPSGIHFTGFKKPPVPLPSFADSDQTKSTQSECSLDAMLPSKCMFFEHENRINDYQRRDPGTIIYPKTKPTMPEITTNEINILQRYSNT